MTMQRSVLMLVLVLSAGVLAGEVSAPPVAPAPAAPAGQGAEVAPAPPPALDVARPLVAEPEIPKSEPPGLAGDTGVEDLSLGWTLLRTMIVLGMVVALAWLTLNVGLRKLLGIRPVVGTSMVTVLERVPLDQRRSLFVVEAAGEVLLIGGSDNSLTLLSKLDRAEVDRIRAARAAGQPVQLSPFLQKLLGRKDAPPPPAA
jgi:flagellar protein FliO/FliZ